MSDFDKFFADKLSQEDHYPGRAKNWHVLNKRLDAFVQGGAAGAQTASLVWKVVAGALLTTSIVLAIKFAALNRNHQQLQQQVAQLQQEQSTHSIPTIPAAPNTSHNPVVHTDNAAQAQPTPASPASGTSAAASPHTILSPSGKSASPNSPSAPLRQIAPSEVHSTLGKNRQGKQADIATAPSPRPATSTMPEKTVNDATTATTTPSPDPAASTTTEKSAYNIATTTKATTPLDPAASTTPEKTTPDAATATPPPPDPAASTTPEKTTPDVATTLPPASGVVPSDTTARSPVAITPIVDTLQQPPITPTASVQQPLIKPLRRSFQIKVGGSLLTGWDRPHRLGISPLCGQGVTASVSLWHTRLWLTAGADWVRFQEDSPVYWSEYHASAIPPKPPKGGGPHQDDEYLLRVESAQRQNRFQMGLRYELPSIWKLHPTVQVGHVWVRAASSFVEYTYEDKDPGSPGPWPGPGGKKIDIITKKEPAHTHSQVWLAGAGLEYALRDWTFHVRTEYQAQAGSAELPTYDMLLLKAGLEYRIR